MKKIYFLTIIAFAICFNSIAQKQQPLNKSSLTTFEKMTVKNENLPINKSDERWLLTYFNDKKNAGFSISKPGETKAFTQLAYFPQDKIDPAGTIDSVFLAYTPSQDGNTVIEELVIKIWTDTTELFSKPAYEQNVDASTLTPNAINMLKLDTPFKLKDIEQGVAIGFYIKGIDLIIVAETDASYADESLNGDILVLSKVYHCSELKFNGGVSVGDLFIGATGFSGEGNSGGEGGEETGINDNQTANIEVYPNPSNGIVNIKDVENAKITVLNILGQPVYNTIANTNNVTLNLSNLETGNYYIQITKEDKTYTQKLILTK